MTHRCQIQMTNFVKGQPIIGKSAIFDKLICFKHYVSFYLFTMILIVYKFLKKNFIMAQVLLGILQTL